jgi:hypothetical protein
MRTLFISMPYRVDDVINEYGAFREIVIDGGK